MGLIVIAVPDNNIKYFRPMFAELQRAGESVLPGCVVYVVSPELRA